MDFGSGQSDLINVSMEIANTTNVNSTGQSCEVIQVKGSPLPLPLPTANVIRSLLITYYISSFLIGLFLNTFLISLIARYKKLQNVTFCFALQILIVDLAHALIIYPSSAANAIAGTSIVTGLCSAIGFLIAFLRIVRSYLMAMLVVDRFCTVFLPFWYNRNRTKVVILTSLTAWLLAMIIALVPVRGLLDCYTFQQFTWACQLGVGCSHQVACTAYRTFVTTTSTFGLLVAFLLYAVLLCKARMIRNKIATTSNEVQPSDSVDTAEAREAARRKKLRERHANTTFFILFVTLVLVSFIPYLFVTFGKIATNSINLTPPPPAYIILAIIARSPYVSLIILDPLVILRNSEVREVIKDFKIKIKQRLLR